MQSQQSTRMRKKSQDSQVHTSLTTCHSQVHKSSSTLHQPHVHKVHKSLTTSSQHRNDFTSLHHNQTTRVTESMTMTTLALNDGTRTRSETVRRLLWSPTLQRLWRLRWLRSILKLRENIHCCVEAQVRVIVLSCTRGARPSSIAQSGTKVKVQWCCRHVVHMLRHMLAASTTCRYPTGSMLHSLKVEDK
jgi:hypothetical protein